ncbi:hypothetical protein [Cryptosporangium sp. NPDC051539]|uniref:hypothetical protein n=1 Tax=Cryptosporangium sp. NPDC051539 TaxID=3363962 RepID=UPI0037BCBA8C
MTINDQPLPGMAWPIRTTPHANGHTPEAATVPAPAAAPVPTHQAAPAAASAPQTAAAATTRSTFADKLAYALYSTAASAAVAGQVWAAAKHVPFPDNVPEWARAVAVAPGVAAAELGGMTTAALAEARQKLGEKAYGYRAISAASAAGAIGLQLGGHADQPYLAGAFAGLSALGYGVWLLQSGGKRRDALRAEGKLADTAPSYGAAQWVKEPRITHRAKQLAVEQGLDRNASLAAAREEAKTQTRRAAIAGLVAETMHAETDNPLHAKIATSTYDLDKLAERIEARTDYDGWADTISGALTPPGAAGSRAGDPGGPAHDGPAHDGPAEAGVAAAVATTAVVEEPVWTVENATKAAHLMLAANDVDALAQLYTTAAGGDPVARQALADADVWDALSDTDRATMVGLAVRAANAERGDDHDHEHGAATTDLKESGTDLKNSEAGSVSDPETEAAAALRRERAASAASRIRQESGRLPSGSQLAQVAGVAKSTANYAMKPLREQRGSDGVEAAGKAVANLQTTRGNARERRSADTDQESAAAAYQGQQALWRDTDQHEHTDDVVREV